MLRLKVLSVQCTRRFSNKMHPFTRTVRILANGLPFRKNDGTAYREHTAHADIVVIGAGIVGSSVAYWLKTRAGRGLNVVVIEKDYTYQQASTVLSAGGLRQQFSLPENVQLSQYCAEFMRNIKLNLGPDVDVQFLPHGYLVLANEESAEELHKNVRMQQGLGVKNELLTAEKIKQRYPWINTDQIELGCIGSESEGWFDPWAFLNGFRNKASELGAEFVHGDVVDFEFELHPDALMEGIKFGTYKKLKRVIYETKDGERRDINFAICVLAAGAHSGELAKKAMVGTGEGLLSIPLPIEPRKRCVYCFDTKGDNAPGINAPMTMDVTGVWMRREGHGYIAGRSPKSSEDYRCTNLDIDHEFFDEKIWPHLAHRIPAFENIKVKSSWAGWYEYNTYDENAIIGPHPYHSNLIIASGFSGHGLQHAPATGRAIAEIIIDGEYKTIDLTRLCFDRLLTDRPMIESNIY